MLKNNNITLIPIEQGHIEFLRKIANDEFTSSKIVRHFYVSSHEQQEWFESLSSRKDTLYFTIVAHYNSTSSVVGAIGLRHINWVNRNGKLIVYIHWPDRGNGYGPEAIEIFCKYCFERLNLHKIYLDVLDHNSAAISVYEKVGFVKEGTLKDQAFINGRYNNMIRMAIFE